MQLLQKGVEQDPGAADQRRRAVGRLPVPDAGARAGGGHDARAFAEFLYGSVLLDWDAERERMQQIKELFDEADEVRIVGEHRPTASVSPAARARSTPAGANIPGGEVFYSPVEDTAEGEIVFSEFPGRLHRPRADGASASVSRGAASSTRRRDANEDYLLEVLDTDEGRAGSASSASAATPASRAT